MWPLKPIIGLYYLVFLLILCVRYFYKIIIRYPITHKGICGHIDLSKFIPPSVIQHMESHRSISSCLFYTLRGLPTCFYWNPNFWLTPVQLEPNKCLYMLTTWPICYFSREKFNSKKFMFDNVSWTSFE